MTHFARNTFTFSLLKWNSHRRFYWLFLVSQSSMHVVKSLQNVIKQGVLIEMASLNAVLYCVQNCIFNSIFYYYMLRIGNSDHC